MTFPDFDEYVKTREQAYADYENREEWVQKMLVNIAKAGYFSSDRTIEEYNRDIWKLEDQTIRRKESDFDITAHFQIYFNRKMQNLKI